MANYPPLIHKAGRTQERPASDSVSLTSAEITGALTYTPLQSPLTTRGDLLTQNPSGTHVRLAIGAAARYLRSDGTDPAWAVLDAGDVAAGTLASARGGTGVSNAGTLTNASDTTITGGGTVALGGFTLTVPETLTAAGRNVANIFTAAQVITPAVDAAGILTVNTAAGVEVARLGTSGTALRLTTPVTTSTVLSLIGGDFAARRDTVDSAGFAITWRKTRAGGACANDDIIGDFNFIIRNSAAAEVQGGLFRCFAPDVTAGAEDAEFRIYTRDNGTLAVRYYFKSDGKFGIGKSVPTGMLHTLALSAATVGIVSQGAASQSADLLQIQDSSANVNALIAATGAAALRPRDAATATITAALTLGHNSSGTPAAAFGTGLLWQGESSTTENTDMASMSALWNVATHASRSADLVLSAYYTTTAWEGLRIRGGSAGTLVSLYGATPVVQAAAIAAPTGGAIVDAEARTAINLLRTALGAALGGIGVTA